MIKEKQKWFYTEAVREHFFNPRNVLKTEKEAKEFDKIADGVGQVGSPLCGDVMRVWIRVKGNKIIDCCYQTFGCASAIASTSVMSEMVKGVTLSEALKITPADIVKKLGGLPAQKIHCSVLGDQALRAAIQDYLGNKHENKAKNH